ncbi:hypothetical protein BDZ89DRAFT_1181898, partial [Hymenopellis radicata]
CKNEGTLRRKKSKNGELTATDHFPGERVRWYRLSAERDRWLEATEKGQADKRNAWMRRAKVYDAEGPEKAGYAAYARERSWLYQDFLDRMKDRVYRAGFGHILHLPRDKALWEHVRDVREGKQPMQKTPTDLKKENVCLPAGLEESWVKAVAKATRLAASRAARAMAGEDEEEDAESGGEDEELDELEQGHLSTS